MDIAPPCPSRLPRSGLAYSDPWLPNGLRSCPCPLDPCLQRMELQPPSKQSKARPTWSVACVFRPATVRLLRCTGAVCHTSAGQYWAALLWYTPRSYSMCSRPLGTSSHFLFGFVSHPLHHHHHHHHRVDEKPLEIVSILASLFSHPPSHPLPVVTPRLLPPSPVPLVLV